MTKQPSKVIMCSSEGEISYLSSDLAGNIPLREGDSLCLASFRSLSMQPFVYPFSSLSRIRDALFIKVKPYSVDGKNVEISPAIFEKDGKSCKGIAWFISSEELERFERGRDISGNLINWPVPIAFASEIHGTGAVIWTDEESMCSMIFENYFPLLYRWNNRETSNIDDEKMWLLSYSRSLGNEIDRFYIADSGTEGYQAGLAESIANTLKDFPAYSRVNISKKVMDSFLVTERTTVLATKALSVFLVAGLLFAAGSFVKYRTAGWSLNAIRDRSYDVYREVFDPNGKIIDPLSQAKAKISALSGTDRGLSLEEVLSRIGAAWKDVPEGKRILNSIRYNGNYVDISGSASEMSTVQSFQKALDKDGTESRIGDIQQIPGGGIRFNMTLRW